VGHTVDPYVRIRESGFFALQIAFARRVARLAGRPFAEALLDATNLYRRLGFGRDFDPTHAAWNAFVAGLGEADDAAEFALAFHRGRRGAASETPLAASVGCFGAELRPDGCVRLHFRNASEDGASPLARSRVGRRRAELATLFERLRGTVSADAAVVGVSWLYNLPAYARVFPAAYRATLRRAPNRFRSMTLWGQFIDRRGFLRPGPARRFRDAVGRLRPGDDPSGCFPLHAQTGRAPAARFFELSIRPEERA